MKIVINGTNRDIFRGEMLREDNIDWTVDVPEELKKTPINITINYASGAEATIKNESK
jgi:hypothetical protein